MNEDDNVLAANHWLLPARGLHGLWDSLIYDDDIPMRLLNYISTTMLFSDKCVDPNIISWNRVVLLHGPPGTGKTSLCKALAQKLAIRLSDRYSYGKLVEINSHSLFSKWFSESGKLVMKMFQSIYELIDNEDNFVCVLIDEVESLTAARKAAASGADPSDAIRVVNALLTQIDQIKKRKNVLILTTSNITQAIDLAFVDRADIKQYIGPPSQKAIYSILKGCLTELMRVGIINSKYLFTESSVIELFISAVDDNEPSKRLFNIAKQCEGLSGRSLRKIPFLAHAFFLNTEKMSLDQYLDALELCVDKEKKHREFFDEC